MIVSAREGVILKRATAALQPGQDARPRRFEQFELHGPARLLLHHDGAGADMATANEITDPNFHHIATAQLAVDGQVEQRSITWLSFPIKPKAYSPHLLWLQCALGTERAAPRSTPATHERLGHLLNVPSLFSCWPWLASGRIAACAALPVIRTTAMGCSVW